MDETGLGDQRFDLLLVAGQAEEQIDFIAPLQALAVDWTFRILGFMGVVLELFTGDAIPTLLASLDDVAVGLNPGKKLLNDLLMPRIGRADQAVIADLPAIPEFAVLGTDTITVGLGAEASGLGCALNLLAVLVTAGDEQDLLTLQPLKPGQGIAGQGRVRTPQMGLVVDVIEGGGEGVSHRRDPTQPFPFVPSVATLG